MSPRARRHLIVLAALTLIVLTAALASPGHAVMLAIGLAGGPWLMRLLGAHDTEPPALRAMTPLAAGEGPVADVLDAIGQPVVLVNNRAIVTVANAAARAAYPGLAAGAPLAFALRSPQVIDAVNAVLADGVMRSLELVERVPVERAFSVVAAPLPDKVGRGRRDAVLTLRETSKERAVEAMRADFVANASHELRTPLASILGFIETLQGAAKSDPAARERFLAIMETQARRMARLVDDLLSLSRIELKEHISPTTTVDLGAIAGDVRLALSELARERGVDLALARPDGPVTILGDRDELASAVENLVENAIKYGKSGGRVDINLTETPTQATLAVRDYGPGIPEDALPRLTERFYRIDSGASRAEGGTGLGLALVKHTINRHRGRLVIENADGGGARFIITLRKPS